MNLITVIYAEYGILQTTKLGGNIVLAVRVLALAVGTSHGAETSFSNQQKKVSIKKLEREPGGKEERGSEGDDRETHIQNWKYFGNWQEEEEEQLVDWCWTDVL